MRYEEICIRSACFSKVAVYKPTPTFNMGRVNPGTHTDYTPVSNIIVYKHLKLNQQNKRIKARSTASYIMCTILVIGKRFLCLEAIELSAA